MKTIKEEKGWKLQKDENKNTYLVTTPEGFKSIVSHTVQSYILRRFDDMVERGWTWVDMTYYTGIIKDGEIKINKINKRIQSDKHELFCKTHFTSESEVIEKLKPLRKEAQKKFEEHLQKLKELEESGGFNIGYAIYGDTYGIHDDYLYIDFMLKGVYCKFRIEK